MTSASPQANDVLATSATHRVPIHGHAKVLAGLERAARSGSLGHAVLLAGPEGVGKRTLARRIAQALLCTSAPEEQPCGACRACRLVAQGGHADLHWVETPLRIEAARELQSALALAPSESAHRVAVLPLIEAASIGAANSLLKLLEEPPAHATLLLTTAAEPEVLPTIRSRARRLLLRPLSPPDAASALQAGWGADAAEADRLARLSAGCLGRAIAILGDADALALHEQWLDRVQTIVGADRAERMALADALAKDRDALPAGLTLWNGWWRDLLLLNLGVDEAFVHGDRGPLMRPVAASLPTARIVDALRATERALAELAAHGSPQLVLEVLLLGLPTLNHPPAVSTA